MLTPTMLLASCTLRRLIKKVLWIDKFIEDWYSRKFSIILFGIVCMQTRYTSGRGNKSNRRLAREAVRVFRTVTFDCTIKTKIVLCGTWNLGLWLHCYEISDDIDALVVFMCWKVYTILSGWNNYTWYCYNCNWLSWTVSSEKQQL